MIRWCDYYLPVFAVVATVAFVLWTLFAFPPVPWSWQN